MKLKNKIIIILSVVVLFILTAVGIFIFTLNKKNSSEDSLKRYFEAINKKQYNDMYEMISKESKEKISKEDFVERNKSIYSGIDLEKIEFTINSKEKESNTVKINYNVDVTLASGKISFVNNTELQKEGKEGFFIKWNSNMIYPNLNDTDKVKVNRITSERGEIQDRNGVTLAGQGQISSVRNRSRKTWRE